MNAVVSLGVFDPLSAAPMEVEWTTIGVNVCYSIHISRLRELAAKTGIDDLDEWADQFSGYICVWSKNDLYDGLKMPDPTSGANVDPATMC